MPRRKGIQSKHIWNFLWYFPGFQLPLIQDFFWVKQKFASWASCLVISSTRSCGIPQTSRIRLVKSPCYFIIARLWSRKSNCGKMHLTASSMVVATYSTDCWRENKNSFMHDTLNTEAKEKYTSHSWKSEMGEARRLDLLNCLIKKIPTWEKKQRSDEFSAFMSIWWKLQV